MRGKLIVIEGTDCTGKETQTKMLVDKLNKAGYVSEYMYFPFYESPTGKIIASNILGKKAYGESVFSEGTANIPPKVAALYYAADRLYNIDIINDKLNNGINVVLDRYVESNMAYQAGKLEEEKDKIEMILWLEHLEFQMLDLPRPDKVFYLNLPIKYGECLRKNRIEKLDCAEKDRELLLNAERAYLLLAERFKFNIVDCVENEQIKSISEINNVLYNEVKAILQENVNN